MRQEVLQELRVVLRSHEAKQALGDFLDTVSFSPHLLLLARLPWLLSDLECFELSDLKVAGC